MARNKNNISAKSHEPFAVTVDMLQRIKMKSRYLRSDGGVMDTQMDPRYAHHFPLFSQTVIPTMLKDSRIRFGLSLIKGSITTYTRFYTSEEAKDPMVQASIKENDIYFPFEIVGETADQEQFIKNTYSRFWLTGLESSLLGLEWGYSGSQVYYRQFKDKIVFDKLQHYPARSVRAITSDNRFIGFQLTNSNKAIYFPKGFWYTHNRQYNRFYGMSHLEGAHVPWHEAWTYGGARDVRKLWWFKNAYDSGIIRFPEGSTNDRNGNIVYYVDVATNMMENRLSGAYMALPSTRDADKQYLWDYEAASAPLAPQGLKEYNDDLDDEKLEGMGIAPEVIESSSSGLGAATGRTIPYNAFIATLFPIVNNTCVDVDEQIVKALLTVNNMPTDYELRPVCAQTTMQQPELEETGLNK